MSLEALVSKYIASTEHVLKNMEKTENSTRLNCEGIAEVLEYVNSYLKDARYYRDKKRFEVSLASIAYCEGLLEALRLLGAIKVASR